MKASHKQLKAVLASRIRNFGLAPVASKLIKFPLFDNFFLNLAKFQDFDVFLLFDFPNFNNFFDFLAYSKPFLPTPNPLTLLLPSFLLEVGLLLLFLLEADLLPSFLLRAGLSGDLVVFSIEVSEAAILLKF